MRETKTPLIPIQKRYPKACAVLQNKYEGLFKLSSELKLFRLNTMAKGSLKMGHQIPNFSTSLGSSERSGMRECSNQCEEGSDDIIRPANGPVVVSQRITALVHRSA